MPKADSDDTTAMSATLHGRPVDSFSSMLPFPPEHATNTPVEAVAVLWRRETFVPFEEFPTLARLRQEATFEIERLLIFLDLTETDTDLEPSLGFNPYGCNDLEGDDCDDLEDGHDSEPWLGATEAINNSLSWRGESSEDREVEDDHDEDGGDDEPSLGSACTYGAYNDQSAWVGGGGTDDREDECEGEGEACEDEGAIDGDSEPDADGEQCGLTVSDIDAARMRRKSGGTGIANIEIDYSEWYGTAVRLPSGEVIR